MTDPVEPFLELFHERREPAALHQFEGVFWGASGRENPNAESLKTVSRDDCSSFSARHSLKPGTAPRPNFVASSVGGDRLRAIEFSAASGGPVCRPGWRTPCSCLLQGMCW